MSVVIDTNVPVVANGKHETATDGCIVNCIDFLVEARNSRILIDDQYLFLDEYRRHLSFSGQPGVGDAFFKWLWSNQGNPAHCRQVSVLRIDGPQWRQFNEFPDAPELQHFDRSDQKFVAVALASQENPDVINAVDTDWWNFRVPLEHHGVRVRFLCLDLMAEPA